MPLPKDRAVFITGASSGIGRAAAVEFARDGARVALFARRKALLDEIVRGIGDRALAIEGDVRKREDVKAAIAKTVATFGALHVAVANAGFGTYAAIESLKDEDLEAVFRTNVLGVLYTIQESMPHLKKSRGQAVFITSILGRATAPFSGAYTMSKHAVTAMADVLRQEVRRDGVKVIVVGPGLTATEFQKSAVNRFEKVPTGDNNKGWTAERVAKAIVKASRKGRRETYLTLPGRALVHMRYWSPRVADWGVRTVLGDTPPGPVI